MMTLENTELIINGEKVLVTNLEVSFEGPGFQDNEMSVRVEGRLQQKFDEEGCWWGGVDMAKEGADQTVIHHVSGPHGVDDWFRKHYLGDWKYNKEEEDMGRNDRCEEKASCDDGYYGGEALAQDLKDLDLDEEQRLLLDYGLVNRAGLVTNKGKEVLLNLLFDKNKAELVKKLQALEEAEKED